MLTGIKRAKAAMTRQRPWCGRAGGAAGVAIAVAVTLAACTSAKPSASASPPARGGQPASPTAQACAWPSMISIQTDNMVIPDAAASYWVQPIVAPSDAQILVSGRYPDARYASLAVYTPSGDLFSSNGVNSSLPDYRIEPDSGSQNPWQRPAAPGGRYTVTIRPGPAPGQPNTLPLPAGTTSRHPGYLMYRVYLPAGANFAGVPLPTLTVKQGSATHVLSTCQQHNSAVPAPAHAVGAPLIGGRQSRATPPMLRFYLLGQGQTTGLLGNADTAYASAWLTRPAAADVVVVTGKAPTSAPGNHPSPWPSPGEDVRYWSMCIGVGSRHLPTVGNRLANGSFDYGCRADDETKLNAAGDYAYVIGSESQRAAISRIPGATFLPFSATQSAPVYLLFLRNTMGGSFAHSVQKITQTDNPAEAAAVMGPYYPHSSVCPLATLEAKGVQACAGKS